METCRECIHERLCRRFEVLSGIREGGDGCENFCDRARVRVMPCVPGDTVYAVAGGALIRAVVAQVVIESGMPYGMTVYCYGGVSFTADQWGVTAFGDREEALEVVHHDDR